MLVTIPPSRILQRNICTCLLTILENDWLLELVLLKFSLELLQRTRTGWTKQQSLVLSGSGSIGSVLGSEIWCPARTGSNSVWTELFVIIFILFKNLMSENHLELRQQMSWSIHGHVYSKRTITGWLRWILRWWPPQGLYTPPRIPIGLRLDFSDFFLAEVSAKFLIPVKEQIPVKESLNRLNLSLVISISLNI